MRESELKDLLRTAQRQLAQQGSLLERLTQAPLAYATVVATGTADITSTDPFVKGDRVSVTLPTNFGYSYDGMTVTGEVATYDPQDPSSVHIKLDPEFASLGVYPWHNTDDVTVTERPKKFRDYAVVMLDGKMIEVVAKPDLELLPGDKVKVSMETMQIVDGAEMVNAGETAIVRQVIDEDRAEVDVQGVVRIVITTRCGDVEKGDKLIVDASGITALTNLGKSDDTYIVHHDTKVTWDDIGGQPEAKQQMREAIELPFQHPELYKFYGKSPVKGVLLYGPPGCGKTMLGKATASSLAALHGTESSTGFFYVKGPEILDKFVGVAEQRIRQLFARARTFRETHGYPAVIMIDEADAIMGKRGSGISSDIERTMVPMFLAEMDGMDDSGAVVILATNRPDVLDPAIVRDGRIDRKVKVTRPDQVAATEIFELYLAGIPLHNGYTREQLAADASEKLFGDLPLYNIKMQGGMSLAFPLFEVINGGMIAGIVDQATSIALRRDLTEGTTPGGMRCDDLMDAIDQVYRQNLDLGHDDELHEYVHGFEGDLISIERVRALTNN